MADRKEKLKGKTEEKEEAESVLDGKGLHDLYRHTTKMIK